MVHPGLLRARRCHVEGWEQAGYATIGAHQAQARNTGHNIGADGGFYTTIIYGIYTNPAEDKYFSFTDISDIEPDDDSDSERESAWAKEAGEYRREVGREAGQGFGTWEEGIQEGIYFKVEKVDVIPKSIDYGHSGV